MNLKYRSRLLTSIRSRFPKGQLFAMAIWVSIVCQCQLSKCSLQWRIMLEPCLNQFPWLQDGNRKSWKTTIYIYIYWLSDLFLLTDLCSPFCVSSINGSVPNSFKWICGSKLRNLVGPMVQDWDISQWFLDTLGALK